MAMDQEEDQLAAAEAGTANPAAAAHKVQIRNALSLSPGLGEDMQSTVGLNSKHFLLQLKFAALFVCICLSQYCLVQPVAVPSVSLTSSLTLVSPHVLLTTKECHDVRGAIVISHIQQLHCIVKDTVYMPV